MLLNREQHKEVWSVRHICALCIKTLQKGGRWLLTGPGATGLTKVTVSLLTFSVTQPSTLLPPTSLTYKSSHFSQHCANFPFPAAMLMLTAQQPHKHTVNVYLTKSTVIPNTHCCDLRQSIWLTSRGKALHEGSMEEKWDSCAASAPWHQTRKGAL